MDSDVYRMETLINSFDVGRTRKLKYSMILRLLQEVAGRQLENRGLGYEELRSKGIVYLLTRAYISIESLPQAGEIVSIETWFSRLIGAQYERFMRIKGPQGEILVRSLWVTVNQETHHILRPSALSGLDIMRPCSIEHKEVPELKAGLPAENPVLGRRTVRWSDIDCNGHVNNAVYADILCDSIPGGLGEREFSFFQIFFQHEAVEGDTMDLASGMSASGTYCLKGTVAGKACFEAEAVIRREI